MNTLRVLASPRIWGPVLGMAAVLALVFYAYLGAASLEGGWRDSLWFFGGGARSEAAGLGDAVWMIGGYLAVAALLGYLISLFRDLFARRKKSEVKQVREPVASGH